MRSLYLIQQVDLNMLTVILLSGYRMLVAYPPWARTDHKPFSVKPKTEKALVWIARLRSALARHHLYGGCRSGQASLHRLDVKVPHSREG